MNSCATILPIAMKIAVTFLLSACLQAGCAPTREEVVSVCQDENVCDDQDGCIVISCVCGIGNILVGAEGYERCSNMVDRYERAIPYDCEMYCPDISSYECVEGTCMSTDAR